MQNNRQVFRLLALVMALVVTCTLAAFGQRADGTLRGTVTDPTGAVVAGATVTATNEQTGVSQSMTTTSAGTYIFPNLLIGPYTLTVESPNFQKVSRKGVEVLPNQVVTSDAQLVVGSQTTTVEVQAGAEVVQTTTSQLNVDFGERAITDLPNPGIGGSVMNLALLAPGTTTQGAGVLGEGGSIGGARPRMNSFNIDGVDDNRVDVTGHTSEVIPEAIADFNLVTNMFSAEMGHSAGGQFNLVTRSGSNSWHGAAWEFNNNRDFNAMDNLEKGAKSDPLTCFGGCPRRVDRNRFGAMMGGPIVKDKFFIFGAYQHNGLGLASAAVTQQAPTAAGLATLKGMADPAVQAILAQFPTAASANGTELVGTTPIPVGDISPAAPNFLGENTFDVNADLNLGNHQLRWRFLYDRQRQPNVNPDTPLAQFTGDVGADSRKVIFTYDWTHPTFVNSLRASYGRFVQAFTVPAQFANFPNAEIDNLGLNIGPEGNSPQSYAQNNYQLLDTLNIVKGKHSIKFGPEIRRWIAPSNFLPRQRGEWDYANLASLVNDNIPDGGNGALRGAGSGHFNGNQWAIYGFVQDDWKVLPRLTLNLGVRYEWTGLPADASLQALNSASSLPGAFTFRVPTSDKNNFAPRLGFAWDVFGDGKTAVRGGFGISYDQTPQNFNLLQLPPQLQSEQNPDITCGLPGAPSWCNSYKATGNTTSFLQGGGLLQVNVPPATVADARLSTGGIMLDQVQPKIMTWTLSVEREIARNTSIELRYLGTRSEEMLIQARLNTRSAFDAGLAPLPTYFKASDIPATITGGSRLLAFDNFDPTIHPEFSLMTAFPNSGSGIYHGASVDLNHRFGHGFMFRTNYTWSHNIDNSTNELFSSRVNPRRPQDWMHPEQDRGNSVLDVPNKFTIAWVYDFPRLSGGNGFLRGVANGWSWTGDFLAESGQPVTLLSGTDSNGNGDSAGDRPVFNPNGTANIGSKVNLVCVGAGGATSTATLTAGCPGGDANVAGYVAVNPAARYVQAQLGALSTVGRDSFRSPGLNVWNMGAIKDTKITERFSAQFRVEVDDVFNHRNFSLAQPTILQTGVILGTVNNALSSTYTNVTSKLFLDPTQFTGGSRTMVLGLKLVW